MTEQVESLPFFHARAAFLLHKKNRLYRVYVRSTELIFIWAGSGADWAARARDDDAANATAKAVLTTALASILDPSRKIAARRKVLDATALNDLIDDHPENVRATLDEFTEVRIAPRSPRHAHYFADPEHQAVLYIRHRTLGLWRLGIVSVEDVWVAVRELPRIFGERCKVDVVWSDEKDRFVSTKGQTNLSGSPPRAGADILGPRDITIPGPLGSELVHSSQEATVRTRLKSTLRVPNPTDVQNLQRRKRESPWSLILGSLFCLGLGCYCGYWVIGDSWRGIQSNSWPKIEGTVIDAWIDRSRPGLDFRLKVAYRYVVDGNQYRNDRVSFPEVSKSGDEQHERRLLAKYPIGRPCAVFYNPANPAQSCLEPGPNYFFLILGGLMTLLISAIGVVGILMDVRRLRNPQLTRPEWLAAVPVAPVLIGPDNITEARANMCSFGLSKKQRAAITPANVEEFIRAVAAARGHWLAEHGACPMRFYCWHDSQAGQLRFSLVSAGPEPLPFGCPIDAAASLEAVARNFLGAVAVLPPAALPVWVAIVPGGTDA